MRWIGKILIGLVLIGLLLFLGYLAYKVILPNWASISFFTYLFFGLILQLVGFIFLQRKMARSESFTDSLLGSLRKAASKPFLLKRIRGASTSFIQILEQAIMWPMEAVYGLFSEIRKEVETPRRYLILIEIRSREHYRALFALTIILIAYALGFAGVSGKGYGKAFVLTMALAVVLRHIRYSVETEGLPARLRRTIGNSYLVFLLIILADFLSLVLAFTLTDRTPPDVTYQNLTLTIERLFRFRELARLVSGQHLSVTEAVIGLAGLLFYLALLRTILRYKDFRQTDEDHLWLSIRFNSLGNFTSALNQLKNIKARTSETELAHTVALFGVNQFSKAEEKTRSIIEQNGQQPTPDKVFQSMVYAVSLAPIPEDVVVSLVSWAVKHRVSDVILQDAIVLLLLSNPQFAQEIEEALSQDKDFYPLARAELYLNMGQVDIAYSLLEKATPGTELEEIIRLVKWLTASLDNTHSDSDEEKQIFQKWADSYLPTIRTLLSDLTQPWEKATAFGQIKILQIFASELDGNREQEIIFLSDDLKSQVAGDYHAELLIKVLESRFQDVTKKTR